MLIIFVESKVLDFNPALQNAGCCNPVVGPLRSVGSVFHLSCIAMIYSTRP